MNADFMRDALRLANEALLYNEVPVGAVIVKNGKIIGEGRNRREERRDPTCHAEIEAIKQAAETLHDWRLDGCSLYVTLEPCPMCAGAIIKSRIDEVIFGAFDKEGGCCSQESAVNIFSFSIDGRRPAVFGGIAEKECAALLSRFFEKRRVSRGTEEKA